MAYSADMDSLTSALAASQNAYQSNLNVAVLKMAAQSDQQVAGLVAQAVEAGKAAASNPSHLGQQLDTYA
jgi:hypothetical protein